MPDLVSVGREIVHKYAALAAWNGQWWDFRVMDYDDRPRLDATAERLEDVATKAAAALAAQFGCQPEQLTVSVEVVLPDEIAPFLDTAERHVALASTSLGPVVDVLRARRMRGHDIAALLAMRALTVTAGPQPRR